MASSSELQTIKDLLRDNGHFVTQARLRLFGYLQRRPALTMKELIALVQAHDQTTIYRNVELFEKLGIINRIRLGWHTRIELSDMFQHHHHHLTCITCGSVQILTEDSIIESQIGLLARRHNFKPIDHQLEIRGLCAACT